MFWFWFFVGPALALAIFSLRGERKRVQFVAERLEPNPQAALPPATVIVPMEGLKDRLGENLAALASLDYTEYELILVARRASDIPGGALPRRVNVVLGVPPRELKPVSEPTWPAAAATPVPADIVTTIASPARSVLSNSTS